MVFSKVEINTAAVSCCFGLGPAARKWRVTRTSVDGKFCLVAVFYYWLVFKSTLISCRGDAKRGSRSRGGRLRSGEMRTRSPKGICVLTPVENFVCLTEWNTRCTSSRGCSAILYAWWRHTNVGIAWSGFTERFDCVEPKGPFSKLLNRLHCNAAGVATNGRRARFCRVKCRAQFACVKTVALICAVPAMAPHAAAKHTVHCRPAPLFVD